MSRRGGHATQAIRILRMFRYLRTVSKPFSVVTLADLFHISERQCRRDLNAIHEAGFKLQRDFGFRGEALFSIRDEAR